jgi:hypothetical protein
MKKRAIFLIVGIMCIAVCIGVVVIKTFFVDDRNEAKAVTNTSKTGDDEKKVAKKHDIEAILAHISFDPQKTPSTTIQVMKGSVDRWPELSDDQKAFLDARVSELESKGILEKYDEFFNAWVNEYYTDIKYSLWSNTNIFFTFQSFQPLWDYIMQNDVNFYIAIDRFMKFRGEPDRGIKFHFYTTLISRWTGLESEYTDVFHELGNIVRETNNKASKESLDNGGPYIMPNYDTNIRDVLILYIELKMKGII